MNHEQAERFVEDWVAAWNAHDLDAVLRHFSDETVFTSPVAAQLLPESNGVVRGKQALAAYWAEGLRRIPELHFEVVASYLGINTLVINYKNHRGNLVNEVLRFDGELVVEGHGTYLAADAGAASGVRSQ